MKKLKTYTKFDIGNTTGGSTYRWRRCDGCWFTHSPSLMKLGFHELTRSESDLLEKRYQELTAHVPDWEKMHNELMVELKDYQQTLQDAVWEKEAMKQQEQTYKGSEIPYVTGTVEQGQVKEEAYRRGFQHGALYLLRMIPSGMGIKPPYEKWFERLSEWRHHSRKDRTISHPEVSKLERDYYVDQIHSMISGKIDSAEAMKQQPTTGKVLVDCQISGRNIPADYPVVRVDGEWLIKGTKLVASEDLVQVDNGEDSPGVVDDDEGDFPFVEPNPTKLLAIRVTKSQYDRLAKSDSLEFVKSEGEVIACWGKRQVVIVQGNPSFDERQFNAHNLNIMSNKVEPIEHLVCIQHGDKFVSGCQYCTSASQHRTDQPTRSKAGTYVEFDGKNYRKYSGLWWVGDTMERVSNPSFILELNERYLTKVGQPTRPYEPLSFDEILTHDKANKQTRVKSATRPSEDDMMSGPKSSSGRIWASVDIGTQHEAVKFVDKDDVLKYLYTPSTKPMLRDIGLRVDRHDNVKLVGPGLEERQDMVDQIIDLQVQVAEIRKRTGMDA